MSKIAWIGTGVMGAPMALHLADAGHEVSVYNRTYEKAEKLQPKVKAFKTIEETVLDAEYVFMIVGYPTDVENVFNNVIQFVKPNTKIIDMTTSSPALAEKLYLLGKEKGVHVIDSPVTGGDLGAINATLSIMVGGDLEIYHDILPLLQEMGQTINYMGLAGKGQHAKLANQIAIGGALSGTAEALSYAQANGLNAETMLAVVTGGSASSWQAVNNGPKMIDKDFKPGFFAKHFLKDLTLALAEKGDIDLPTLALIQSQFEELVNKQDRGEDSTAVLIDLYQD